MVKANIYLLASCICTCLYVPPIIGKTITTTTTTEESPSEEKEVIHKNIPVLPALPLKIPGKDDASNTNQSDKSDNNGVDSNNDKNNKSNDKPSFPPESITTKDRVYSGKKAVETKEIEETYNADDVLGNIKPKINIDGDTLLKPEFDSKTRSEDYLSSYKFLREQNPDAKIYITVNGLKLKDVQDFQIMPNGSTALITYKRGVKTEQKVFKVEQIQDLGIITSPYSINNNDN
ncbi:MAG: hypothetical protein K0S74_271 [Chlamydiales bacterium]|jgi:hypothetical protein|nr:hypothetical protein [Chlamydiales bacterium]